MKPKVIGKSSSGCIQVSATAFKNVDYIDVRNFYKDRNTEEFKPTPKGIMIPVDKVEEVAQAMLEQVQAFRKSKASGPKLYVVLDESRARNVGSKQVKVLSSRVFEELTLARRFRKRAEGSVIFAFVGDYELEDDSYVFPSSVKKRRVATYVDGAWVKQCDL